MSQSVTIKSNKYGINLVLDPEIGFDELLKDVVEKFKASSTFFKNAKLALSFEGRKLSEEEEQQIISAIESNTSIEILCIVENGTRQEAVMKEQVEAFYDAVQQQYENAAAGNGPEQFYRGTLRSGQVISSESSVTIIGDVNPGAKIISQGNIVILGALKGNAQAGCMGGYAADSDSDWGSDRKESGQAGTETSYTPSVKDTGSGSTDRHCKRWKYLY